MLQILLKWIHSPIMLSSTESQAKVGLQEPLELPRAELIGMEGTDREDKLGIYPDLNRKNRYSQ